MIYNVDVQLQDRSWKRVLTCGFRPSFKLQLQLLREHKALAVKSSPSVGNVVNKDGMRSRETGLHGVIVAT